jgi:transcriptional regulator with XRE-family HTH domain
MGHSIFTEEYTELIRLLRVAREDAGMTQAELGKRLGQTQSFVSKCERGERRLDVIELRHFCKALGADFPKLIASIDSGKRKG